MPKVLHVIPYMAEAAGGPPVVVRRLIDGARISGWNAEVITTTDYAHVDGRDLSGDASLTLFPSQLSSLRGRWRRTLAQAIRSSTIVHCHTLWSPLVSNAAAIARALRVPYVMAPHGMLDPYSFGQKTLKKQLYLAAIERKAISAASRILFTANDERLLAEQTFGDIPNAAVIPLGADPLPTDKSALASKFCALHPDLKGKRLLLFMGRLHPKKRPHLLLDLMASLRSEFPDAVLVYVGSGDEIYVSQIKARAQELGLANHVRFLGHLSGDAKHAALAAADLFLLPSHQENFAIALAEALHAGVPAIITKNINIWREVVEANAGVAVDDNQIVENVTIASRTLLLDAEKRAEMSENAVRLASRAFTWDATCRQTLKLYEDILAET